jgi:hypothetical protein
LTHLKNNEREKTKKGKEGALIDKGMEELILITTETVVMNSWSQMVRGLKRLFAQRDKKQTMIGLRWIFTNWFKSQLCAPARLSGYRLWQ